MAQRTLPGLGLTGYWPLGYDLWKDEMDTNLRLLSLICQASFKGFVSAEPGSPADGDIYIFTAGAEANKFLIRDDGVWAYIAARQGTIAFNEELQTYYAFDGSLWNPLYSEIPAAKQDDPVRIFTTDADGNVDWETGGEITVQGEALLDGDRVGLGGQSVLAENLIYIVRSAGTWDRAPGWDDADPISNGTTVLVEEGTHGGKVAQITTTDDFVIGTDGIEWAVNPINNPLNFKHVSKKAAAYTLAVKDSRRWMSLSRTGAQTVTIPAHATAAIGLGTENVFYYDGSGSGTKTIQTVAGVTLNGTDAGSVTLTDANTAVLVKKIGKAAWITVSLGGSGSGGASVTVSETPPVSPGQGDMWWDSSTAILYIYYDDGTSSQWVTASMAGAMPTTRTLLTAGRSYYVRKDGSDSNTGLENTAGGAFLTIQKAINVALNTLDTQGYDVTIQVGDGTYVEEVTVTGQLTGGGALVIQGNTTTPTNCVIAPVSGSSITATIRASITVAGFSFVSAAAHGIKATEFSTVVIAGACDFGACLTSHITILTGSRVSRNASITLSGASSRHVRVLLNSSYEGMAGTTVTITGTPAFSNTFAEVSRGSNYYEGNASAYVGAATGVKYTLDSDCSLRSTAAVAVAGDILPGDKPGSVRPLEGERRFGRNLLYNAAGRLREGVSGAVGDDTYGLHNRWYVLSQSGNVTPSALDDVADGVPSLIRLTNSHGSSQRVGYAQIVPGYVAKPMRGRRLFLSCTARMSNTLNVRASVLSWSGVEDVLVSDVINDWTSSTYTVGNFFTNPVGLSVLLSASLTLASASVLYNRTLSTWFVDVPSDCNNLIVIFHTASVVAAGATFDIRMQMEEGSAPSEFEIRPLELEKTLCSAFYQKKTVRTENGSRHIPLLPMRASPTVTASAGTPSDATENGFELAHTSAADSIITASAEL